jgi:4-hydroxy-3-polyprenylbenzoate decarboxylase
MSYDSLRDFLLALESAGELRRITAPVDPHLEITEILDRVMKSPGGGPALLFENVIGSTVPLAANVLGSHKRMAMALGTEDAATILSEVLEILEPRGSMGLIEKIQMLPQLKRLSDAFPKEVPNRSAPCMRHIIEEPSFDLLPVCKCWPDDGGRYITFPMVFTRDPRKGGALNVGMYRLQVFDSRTCGMHWHLHKGGADHLRAMAERGEKLPVTIVLGCGPVEIFSAACPLPPDLNEMLFAGLIKKSSVRVTPSRTNDLLIPAEAEIVLEGYVDPTETRLEGPFGDHTGYYSLADQYPVFHLTAMSTREPLRPAGTPLSPTRPGILPPGPIYPHTIVGIPPMEDAYMGAAIERLFLPILKKQLPEVVDMHMPIEGGFHNLLLVSIKKAYPGHARKVMHAIWGLGQAMFSKLIVVVDADVNIKDYRYTAWRALNSVDYARDIEVVKGPVDDLDHASQMHRYGGKMGIDATTKWPSEGHTREWPQIIQMSREIREQVDRRWKELALD